jgi:hypothetical protein
VTGGFFQRPAPASSPPFLTFCGFSGPSCRISPPLNPNNKENTNPKNLIPTNAPNHPFSHSGSFGVVCCCCCLCLVPCVCCALLCAPCLALPLSCPVWLSLSVVPTLLIYCDNYLLPYLIIIALLVYLLPILPSTLLLYLLPCCYLLPLPFVVWCRPGIVVPAVRITSGSPHPMTTSRYHFRRIQIVPVPGRYSTRWSRRPVCS